MSWWDCDPSLHNLPPLAETLAKSAAIERFIEAEHLRDHEFVVAGDFNMRELLDLCAAFGPYFGPGGPHAIVVEFDPADSRSADRSS